jgi:hypothetical protein
LETVIISAQSGRDHFVQFVAGAGPEGREDLTSALAWLSLAKASLILTITKLGFS